MSFNRDEKAATLITLGRGGGMIDYSGGDVTLGVEVKAVVVCSAGDVVYYPAARLSGTAITLTGMTAGQVLPHIPGKIVQTGTTATLATVED